MSANTIQPNKMRTMSTGRLLLTMALPLAISMLVQAFYNVVDSIFVSMIPGNGVTALSLAFPVQNLMIGFATGVGVGMNSLLSKSLGENNPERANRAAGNGIVLTLITVLLFMIFGFVGTEAYYNIFKVSRDTFQSGCDYTSICCIFSLGIFVEILGERLLQASGKTIFTLFSQGAGAVLNIILDPIFILGSEGMKAKFGITLPFDLPAYGVAGAAIATVIGQWVAALLAVIFNVKYNSDIRFGFKYLKPHGQTMKKILAVGVPSIIMMAIGSVMNLSMNNIFLSFKDVGETASGVFGVYFKLQSFFLMPLFGINNAAISIIAYNYGARLPKRITQTLKWSLFTAMGIMLLGVAVFQILPGQLMSLFSNASEESDTFMKLGISALRIVSLHFPLAAVGIALTSSFQALGNGIYSTIVSLCRQLLALVPAAWLLSLSGNIHAVWWAFPIAEIVSTTLSLIFFAQIYRKRIKPMYQ